MVAQYTLGSVLHDRHDSCGRNERQEVLGNAAVGVSAEWWPPPAPIRLLIKRLWYMGVYENTTGPHVGSQRVSFPSNEDPNKVPLISETHMFLVKLLVTPILTSLRDMFLRVALTALV